VDRRSGLIPFRREPLDHSQRSSGLERVVRRGLASGCLAGIVALIRVGNCGVTFAARLQQARSGAVVTSQNGFPGRHSALHQAGCPQDIVY
jgi:hypothetical protein